MATTQKTAQPTDQYALSHIVSFINRLDNCNGDGVYFAPGIELFIQDDDNVQLGTLSLDLDAVWQFLPAQG